MGPSEGPIRVTLRPRTTGRLSLLISQQRTCGNSIGMSVSCQEETHASQQIIGLYEGTCRRNMKKCIQRQDSQKKSLCRVESGDGSSLRAHTAATIAAWREETVSGRANFRRHQLEDVPVCESALDWPLFPSWDLSKHSTSFASAGWKARRSSRREAVGDALLQSKY